MLKFKQLELEDRDLIMKYLEPYSHKTYEYSFVTLYLWRKLCNVEFAIENETLILRKNEEDKGTYYMEPISLKQNNLQDIVGELIQNIDYKNQINLFRDVEEKFLDVLKDLYGDKVKYKEDLNNFDYIYDTKKMMCLSGKKLHGKKNHYNQFVNTYKYEIRDIDNDGVIDDCIAFNDSWTNNRKNINNHLILENEGIRDTMKKMSLLNIVGVAVYVENKLAGYSFGEKVNEEMAIIHVEKGDTEYKGIYAFLNKTLIDRYFENTVVINREEDLGVEGLRKAKMSYHPLRLEKKYIVDIVA